MKIELTIKVDYLPNWGLFEGIREILQNAKDAETEFNAPMKVHMRGKTLIIENEGCTLPYEALLLGHSTKTERSNLIGKFGEGFKLGILALIREGYDVKIRNGSEVWEPEIVDSNKFNAKVLAFDIQKNRKYENRICVEISQIEPSHFLTNIKPCFLWLYKPKKVGDIRNKVSTDQGDLLLADHHKGKVFVKGIWVETNTELNFGYDLHEAIVDRDRKMINSFDLSWKTQCIWRQAIISRPDLFGEYFNIIELNGIEAKHIDSYHAERMPEEFIDYIIKIFENRHGNKAIPVSNLGESAELEHFGRQGIVVNNAIRALIENRKGTLQKVQEELKNEVTKTYSWHELEKTQKENIFNSIELINNALEDVFLSENEDFTVINLKDINVVDFRSKELEGTFVNGNINISIKSTNNFRKCLTVFVHELSHKKGKDGEKSHVTMIEYIWGRIVEKLISSQ